MPFNPQKDLALITTLVKEPIQKPECHAVMAVLEGRIRICWEHE